MSISGLANRWVILVGGKCDHECFKCDGGALSGCHWLSRGGGAPLFLQLSRPRKVTEGATGSAIIKPHDSLVTTSPTFHAPSTHLRHL